MSRLWVTAKELCKDVSVLKFALFLSLFSLILWFPSFFFFLEGRGRNSPKILLINVLLLMLLSISFYLHGHFRDKMGMFTSVIFCQIAVYPKYLGSQIIVVFFFPLDIYSLKIISFKNKVGKKWELCIPILFACSHKIKLICLSSGCITSQIGHVFVFFFKYNWK